MLSVSKLGVGQQAYYLDTVATGLEDYYSGRGEQPGVWHGTGAEVLGLSGEVDAVALGHVLDGRDPTSGVPLGQYRKDRLPGYDLTFSAPKSVSVLWALADSETARAVRDAHETAVSAALGWLERDACRSRKGADGIEHISGDGFVAARFAHRTSRALDPQIHTHVLVANTTRCDDGHWRALDGKALLWQARTAGFLYRAALRHELTARLGIDWDPNPARGWEIAGIPTELRDLFSTRRHEIEDELVARGQHSARAARVVALDTRPAKSSGVDQTDLRDRWRGQTCAADHDPDTIVATSLGRAAPPRINRAAADQGTEVLLGPGGLTEQTTAFDRRAILRAWCDQLPHGAAITTVERLARHTLRDPDVIALHTNSPFGNYTTHELLDLEQALVNAATASRDSGIGITADDILEGALSVRPELSAEQVEAVARLCLSGHGIELVVAAAGTGKTFCLDTAAATWRDSGHQVIGTALAATAARQLQHQTGVPSDTLALRNLQLAEHTLQFDSRTVVIVDEAAMAGTRQLAPIIQAAHAARAKVVLVGDPRQLDAISAGGLLAGLARRHDPIALTQNRRQTEPWEQDALEELREGRAECAIAAYEEHGRIVTAPDTISLRNQMVADWHAATVGGHRSVMLAHHRHDVDDLNHRACRALRRSGALSGPALAIGDLEYQAGHRIVCLRNDRRLGVTNGTLATITHIDADARAITARGDDGQAIALPARYLDAEHIAHAYALTIHKSQGLTLDRVLLLGGDSLDAHLGYTALSRARTDTRIYLHEHAPHDVDAPSHGSAMPSEIEARVELAAALEIDRADRLAIDHGPDIEQLRGQLRQLLAERQPLAAIRDALPADQTDALNALRRERGQLTSRASLERRDLTTIESRRPQRRDRAEHTGRRLAAQRRLENMLAGLDRIDAAISDTKNAQQRRSRDESQNAEQLERLDRIERQVAGRLDRLIDHHEGRPPLYLHELGPAPRGAGDNKWRTAARTVETYRLSYGITDPDHPLGPVPDDPTAQDDRQHASDLIRELSIYRARIPDRTPNNETSRDLGMEL